MTALLLLPLPGRGASQAPVLNLTPAESARLEAALQQGGILTPAQALARVAQFRSAPVGSGGIGNFLTDDPYCYFGPYYSVSAGDGSPGDPSTTYDVSAGDGLVFSGFRSFGNLDQAAAEVPPETAEATALQFLHEHFPGLLAGDWVRVPAARWEKSDTAWEFDWRRVHDLQSGARSRNGVRVSVRRDLGLVKSWCLYDTTLRGPTTPLVSLAAARQLAAPFAAVDPTLHPFVEAGLEMWTDRFGVQSPVWVLLQRVPDGDLAPEYDDEYDVSVDALTGEVLIPRYYGIAPRRPRQPKRPPRRPPIRLQAAGGQPFTGALSPELRAGRLWLRAEFLLGLGAAVRAETERLEVRFGGAPPLRETELRAVRRHHSWWLPLREAARHAGWRLRRDARGRLAVALPR